MSEEKNQVMKSKRSIFRLGKEGIIFALVLVIGLVALLNANDEITVDLDEYDISEFAHVSYILGNTIRLYESGEHPSVDGATDFENEIDQFHNYFEIYRMYVDQEDVEESMALIELEDHEYEYQLTYEVEDQEYILFFSQHGSSITTELLFGDYILNFEGSLSEQEEETAFDLYYSKDEFYASVSPSDFLAEEGERVYFVDTWIENIQDQSTITIQEDQFEVEVMIEDDNNTYNITKSASLYLVDYSVSRQIGSIEIETVADTFGVLYNYTIVENGETFEINRTDKD